MGFSTDYAPAVQFITPDPANDTVGESAVFHEICRDILGALGCTRASLWRYTADGAAIRCARLLDQRGAQFPLDMELTRTGIPLYFDLIETERLLAVPDFARHPATRNLAAPYARTSGIHALIDVLVTATDRTPLAIVSGERDHPHNWREADILSMFQITERAAPLFRGLGRLARA